MKTLERYYEKLREWPAILKAEAIDITAAARWYWSSQDFLGNYWGEFPAPMPPFPTTWLEYHGPIYGTDAHGESFELSRTEWYGFALASAVRLRDSQGKTCASEAEFVTSDAVSLLPKHFRPYAGGLYSQLLSDPKDATTAWLLVMQIGLADYEGSPGLRLGPSVMASLDDMGNIVPHTLYMRPHPNSRAAGMNDWPERMVELADYHTRAFLFALSLMNAKNVSIIDAPPLPPAVAKKRERKGQPVLKFKTLHIEPMRARVKREKQEGQSEVKLALHLCRGHFKDYRDSGGLFGKYKGLYWWDSHVRGTEEAGRVIKDYELGKPKGA